MCQLDHHPWGLATGLPCLGAGDGHTPRYEASDAPDRHSDEGEQ